MTSLNNVTSAKRDLHVGGVGSEPGAALSTMAAVDPLTEASATLLRQAADLLQSVNASIRENPWAAIGVVGLLGLGAGYLLSRRI